MLHVIFSFPTKNATNKQINPSNKVFFIHVHFSQAPYMLWFSGYYIQESNSVIFFILRIYSQRESISKTPFAMYAWLVL